MMMIRVKMDNLSPYLNYGSNFIILGYEFVWSVV